MAAAAPALRKRAVRAAVVVIAGFVPHEALKRLVIAIGEIHRIPPFGIGLGLAVGIAIYKKTCLTVRHVFHITGIDF